MEVIYLLAVKKMRAKSEGIVRAELASRGVVTDEAESLLARLRRALRVAAPTKLFGNLGISMQESVEDDLERVVPGYARTAVAKSATVQRFALRNAGLIKRLSEDVAGQLARIITENDGKSEQQLGRQIAARFGVTERKAQLWGRSQALKLNSQITFERYRAVGIKRYAWTTSGANTREMHEELGARSDAGETFSVDDPPVTNEQGDTNNPGEDHNCRCTPFPVLD